MNTPTRKGVSIRKVFTGDLEQRFYELLTETEKKDLLIGVNKQKLNVSLLHRKLRSEKFRCWNNNNSNRV